MLFPASLQCILAVCAVSDARCHWRRVRWANISTLFGTLVLSEPLLLHAVFHLFQNRSDIKYRLTNEVRDKLFKVMRIAVVLL